MSDDIGNRMKENYENRTRFMLPRRSHTIIRVDGKAFHTYTRNLKRPFDNGFMDDMDFTASYLCKNIQGAKFGFVQSDEISILLTDYDKITTDAWFDNNVQKMASVSASMATKAFNEARMFRLGIEGMRWGEFDSRVFQIPEWTEVENYFIWRQQDCVRNSISSVAQSLYSHKELDCKNTDEMQEMIFQRGTNWNDYGAKYKRGRAIIKTELEFGETIRHKWTPGDCPNLTQERDYIKGVVLHGDENG